MRSFITGFCHGKLRYFTPLLGAEIHHEPTLAPLEIAIRSCLRTELDACVTTPIPLLYAGTQRPYLRNLIARDSSKAILSAIASGSPVGHEYLNWNGLHDGWSPMGLAMHTFQQLHIHPERTALVVPLNTRVRNGMGNCSFHYEYTKEEAAARLTAGTLLPAADYQLWTDGSFIRRSRLGGTAAILYHRDREISASMTRFTTAGSSFETEFEALMAGLHLLRDVGPIGTTIRIYTDSKSLVTYLRGIGLSYKLVTVRAQECAHLITRLQETNQVHFHWIPGHAQIARNEDADSRALAAQTRGRLLTLPVPVSTPTAALDALVRQQARNTTSRSIKPSSQPTYPERTPFKKTSPANLFSGAIFRLRTGHTRCLAHFRSFNIVADDTCRLCETDPETPEHLLVRCPALSSTLQELRNKIHHNPARLHYLYWQKPEWLDRMIVKARRAGAIL